MLEKRQKFHHSVTELGNIQVRLVTEYLKDGKLIDKKYGDPMTPSDVNNMKEWDNRSRNIVAAITDGKVMADFAVEKQEPIGVGLEEIVKYDRVLEENGRVAIRRIIRIFDEGKEVSKKHNLSWIIPGDDPSGNDVMSRAVAEKLHTPEVVEAYEAKMAEIEP